jgi:hypothetical protein
MIVAKPVVKDKFWILKQDDNKVGNIEASSDGYTVRIKDKITKIKNISTIRRDLNFSFDPPAVSKRSTVENSLHGYCTGPRSYNGMWDVKKRLPLFTKSQKSKSWYAAGWYLLKQRHDWEVVQSPKLITLQRYAYQGPFHSKEEANERIS